MGRFSLTTRYSIAVACLLTCVIQSNVHAQLVISEIAPNAEVEALEQYGGGEWFEICNVGQNDMDISGYTIGHYEDASFGQSDFYLGNEQDNWIVVLDNTPPEITCPQDTIIEVPPCVCEAIFTFTDPIVFDENGDPISIQRIDTTGLESGDNFPAGTTTLTYSATSANGNSTTCSYDVTIISGDPGPIILKTQVNFSLSEFCDGYPTAFMLLEGTPPCSEDAYYVSVLNDQNERIDEDSLSNFRNELLTVRVDYACFPNFSTTSILIEDKYEPTLICVNDTVSCDSFFHYEIPQAFDNCDGELDIVLLNETLENVACTDPNISRIITQTYVAIDDDNRRDTCTQTLSIEKFDLSTVEFTGIDTTIYCGDVSLVDDNGNPSPAIAGYPITGTTALWPDQNSICNVTSTYFDMDIPGTSCGRSILRQWSVMYWDCFQDGMVPFMQTINIVDDQGPTFTCPTPITINTDPTTCTAQISGALPLAQDDCNNGVRFEIDYPNSFEANATNISATLDVGLNEIIITAVDTCGMRNSCTWEVLVEDNEQPIAISSGGFTVQLTSEELTVYASQINNGSFDNCGSVHVDIFRMNAPCDTNDLEPSAAITICCEDIGNDVMVGILVTDNAGNTSQGMVVINVEDNQAPVLVQGLPDITISCDYNYLGGQTQAFGTIVTTETDRDSILISADSVIFSGAPLDALITENCSMVVTEEIIDEDISFSCGTGYVTRQLTATDANGNSLSMQQTITFVNFAPFDNDDINWPDNLVTMNACTPDQLEPIDLEQAFSEPILNTDGCDDVAVGRVDDIDYGPFESDTLFVINRQWSAADWCQNTNGSFLTLDSTQTITVLNNVEPEIVRGCSEMTVCNYSPTCEDLTIDLDLEAIDDCTDSQFLDYLYEVDFNSDNSIDVTGATNTSSVAFPIGQHLVKWTVTDLQGNQDICFQSITVENCILPSPICIQDIEFALVGVDTDGNGSIDDEQITIHVADVDGGSSNSCSQPFALSFSTDINNTDTTYTCSELGLNPIALYITDLESGNQAFCTTAINIIDTNNVDICAPQGVPLVSISGTILSEVNKPTDGVSVSLLGASMINETETGTYSFGTMETGGNYIVEPHHETYPTDGITTLDILLIQKHILGISPLDSPYKILAADVNGSEHISGADIIELRKLLLGVTTELQYQDSWQFVWSDHQFVDTYNPWMDAMTNYEVGELHEDMEINFISLKTGDVNNSSSNLTDDGIDVRSAIYLDYSVEKLDNEIIIPVYISMLDQLDGMQFSMRYNHHAYSFSEFVSGAVEIQESFFSTKDQDLGVIDLSWINPNIQYTNRALNSDNEIAFYIILDQITEGKKMADLQLQTFSEGLKAQAYLSDGSVRAIEFRAQTTSAESTIELYQNRPNPWNKNTIISFYLPRVEKATLTINDVTGRVIYQQTDLFAQGMNEITIDASKLGNAGIYYYSLKTGTYQNMKKMILIE